MRKRKMVRNLLLNLFICFSFSVFNRMYSLQPVNLIVNGNFDRVIKKYDRFFEWDTSTKGSLYGEKVKFELPDSSNYVSPLYSISIDTREDAEGSYKGFIFEKFILPKKASDLSKLLWKHYVLYKENDYNKTYAYFIALLTPVDTVVNWPLPFLYWIYSRDTTEEIAFFSFKSLIPEEKRWYTTERDLKVDFSAKGISLDTEFGGIQVECRSNYEEGISKGQKVYWDDIKLTGWADYDRALTRIVSGMPEKNKPYRAEVVLWNNGRKGLSASRVKMLVIKDSMDTLYNRDVLCPNLMSDDSVKVSFKDWTPIEDGNYRIEFYTGYLWGKYFGDELVIDECDDDDYLFMDFTLGVKENGGRDKVVRWSKQSSKYIEFEIGITDYADISIYDIQGRKMDDIYFGYVNSGEKITYDWDDLSKGVYFIKVEIGDKSVTEKVVKIR